MSPPGINAKSFSQNYEAGTTVNITAYPNFAAVFTGWEGDVPDDGEGEEAFAVTMDGDKQITATFEDVAVEPVVYDFEKETVVSSPTSSTGMATTERRADRGGVQPTSVIGNTDRRRRVNNTLAGDSFLGEAADAVVQVSSPSVSGRNLGHCSGTIVSEFHVLTAAHCLSGDGLISPSDPTDWHTNLTVQPAANYHTNGSGGNVFPYSSVDVTLARVYDGWYNQGIFPPRRFDFALLTLNRSIGEYTGTLPMASYAPDDVTYSSMTVAGYPGPNSKPGPAFEYPTLWYQTTAGGGSVGYEGIQLIGDGRCNVDDQGCYDQLLTYEADTSGGQSGGTVFNLNLSRDGNFELVGVHLAASGGDFNVGHRITAKRLADVNTWIQQDRNGRYVEPPQDLPELVYEDPQWTHDSTVGSSVDPSDQVIAGVSDVEIEHEIRNIGTGTVDDVDVAYYASDQCTVGDIDESDRFGSNVVAAPSPFDTTEITWEGTIPPDVVEGEEAICMQIDPDGDVAEFDAFTENDDLGTDYDVEHLGSGAYVTSPENVDIGLEISDVEGAAGGVDSPNGLSATVEITVDGDVYDEEVSADQFELTVGERSVDPATISVSPIAELDGRYKLHFMPPTQDSPGSYDFAVDFAGAASDQNADAIRYGSGGGTQIAASIQLDRSESMSGIITEAIEGGVTFVQQATDEDYVSVVSYSSSSRVDHGLARLGDSRQGVINAIESLSATGSTNVGGAMEDGLDTLDDTPDGAIAAGILMTDGKVNTGPEGEYEDDDGFQDRDRTPPYRAEEKYILNEIVPQYNEAGICLYTIGFTEDADELFMQDVAEESNCGYYEFAGEAGEVESIQNTLAAVFRDIQGDVSDADTIRRDTGTVDAGETRTEQFGVDDTVTRTTANIQVEGADFSGLSAGDADSPIQTDDVSLTSTGSVSLLRPDGSTVDGSSPNVDVSIVGNSIIYRIEKPAPGLWTYEIRNTQSESSEYTVDVTGGAQATMELSTAGERYYVGDEADVTATLIGPDGTISGATVEAMVTHPDGTITSHTLTEQLDGIYTGAIDADGAGTYTATVTAEKGTLSRMADVSWSVEQTPPITITQSSSPTVLQGESGTFDLVVDPAADLATTSERGGGAGTATVAIRGESPTEAASTSRPKANGAFFDVSDLKPKNAVFERGDTINPTAAIENTGDQPGEQLVEYRIGGEIFADGIIQIDPDQPPGRLGVQETLVVDVPPGEYTHGFYTEDDSVTGTLVVHDRIVLGTSGFEGVGHDGTIPGSAVALDTRVITGTDTKTVATTVTVPEDAQPGDYSGTVRAFRDDGTVVTEDVTFTVSKPPAFELNVVGTGGPVSVGEDLTVTVDVHNAGDIAATKPVRLAIPGLGTDETTVSLNAGQTATVTFSLPTDTGTAGQYDVTVTSDDDSVTTTAAVEEDGAPSIDDYADEDGIVRATGLNRAVQDYLGGEIAAALLNDVIQAYLTGEPVT